MFGITDARAMEGTRREEEDIPGLKSNMISLRKKRSRSSENTQPRIKQLKHGENITSWQQDDNDSGHSTTGSHSSATSSNKESVQSINNKHQCKRHVHKSKNQENDLKDGRLNKISECNAQDLQINYNLGDLKLKNLKIVLEDIKYSSRINKIKYPSGKDFWEVEQILGKKQMNGVLLYLIKWKNWHSKYNTWEPRSNLVNCSDTLNNFEAQKVSLLNYYKKQANFYPTVQDVENYLNKLKHNGRTIENIIIDQNETYSQIKNMLKKKKRNVKRGSKLRYYILRAFLFDLRQEQLESLQEWECEMNNITNGKPLIRVENLIDLEGAPEDFYYIDEYLPGAGVIIPDDPPIGCECKNCDAKAKCCFTQYDDSCPYTLNHRICVPPGTPIYECNKRCACDVNCRNRVVQRGTDMHLCIFRTANERGWGVKTLQAIKKGTFVIQYVGEVITSEEADKRGKEYDAAGRTYLFDLDYNESEDQCPYTVDAAMYGNVSHFINHSCDPNLAVYGVWINCLDPNLPKLALFAIRDIKANEEITFDYMCQSSKNSQNSVIHDTSTKSDVQTSATIKYQGDFEICPETPESDFSENKTLCKCGAKSCRRYLFGNF